MLDWDDLKTFLAVSRQGTLSGAARALHVTQTTVGRRLEALHGRAGAKLLVRTPAGFVLTPAGERALASVERMEAEALAVERAVTGQDLRLAGEVRIASVEAFAAYILAPGLQPLLARYPGLSVEIDVDTRALSLARREADIAVRLATFAQHEAVVRKAGEMAFGLFAAPGYLARAGAPDWEVGADGAALIALQDTLAQTPEAQWLAGIAPKARTALKTNSREGQRQAARAGLGIACLPRYLADGDAGLVRLTPPRPAPRRAIWVGVHRDTRHMPRIRIVLDHLAAALAAAAGALAPAD